MVSQILTNVKEIPLVTWMLPARSISQSILAIITQTWVKPIETKITELRNLDQCSVTTNSLRGGIVLWEMLEQICQQRVCHHTDVVQTGQAGWTVLILHWKMVKFIERSALVIALLVSNPQQIFQLKNILYPPSCTSRYCGTDWMWSKYTLRSKKTHKSLRRYMCIRFLCDIVNLSSLSWTLSAEFNFGGKQVFISLEW